MVVSRVVRFRLLLIAVALAPLGSALPKQELGAYTEAMTASPTEKRFPAVLGQPRVDVARRRDMVFVTKTAAGFGAMSSEPVLTVLQQFNNVSYRSHPIE